MMGGGIRIALGLALFLGACQSSPPPSPEASVDEGPLAARALEAGEYERAAGLYRRALVKTPDRLSLHYGLGVAASHLDLKPEAIREFRWVLERGEAGKVEVENARGWLVRVGALARGASKMVPRAAPTPAAVDDRQDSATATFEGRAVSIDASHQAPMKRIQLFLIEQPSRVNYYRLRTDEDGHFYFPKVAPGVYKLSDRVVGSPRWRLRVEIKPGQTAFLDLGPGNSTKVRDDFPGQP